MNLRYLNFSNFFFYPLCILLFLGTSTILTAAATNEILPIKQALADTNGDFIPDLFDWQVTVEGIANAVPNATSRRDCFASMQDKTGGVVLHTDHPERMEGKFKVGDRIRVHGRVRQFRGLELISIKSIEVFESGLKVTPRDVLISDLLNENYVGQLVRIRGELELPLKVESKAEGLMLRDRTGQIAVYLTSKQFHATDFVVRLLRGGEVELTGIAGQSKTTPPFDSGYCIFPRSPSDIEFIPASRNKEMAILMSFLSAVAIGAYLWNRRKTRQALEEKEQYLSSIVENSPECVKVLSPEGSILQMNKAGLEMIQCDDFNQVLGKPAIDLIAPEDRKAFWEFHQSVCKGERSRLEFEIIGMRNRRRLLESIAVPIRLSKGINGHLAVTRDITEQKRMQAELLHSQKMESIGQLAGGVAHDFNNLLTVIQAHADLISNSTNLDSARESGAAILQASQRGANLTRQLLTFGRKTSLKLQPVYLSDVVSDLSKMLNRTLGEAIELQLNLSPNVPPILADVGMLSQAILNLALNARDAMPKGGKLRIEVSALNANSLPSDENPKGRNGSHVLLSISDDGTGIPNEVLPRIFEPFFTTKDVGKGSGLGLAMVHSIVDQHGGWITVQSIERAGTSFTIYFAATEERPTKAPPARAESIAPKGNQTILAVEDEDLVRNLVCAILSSHGYKVLEAACGQSALKVWKQHKQEIDLVLTDIVLPNGVDGYELADRLIAEAPGLKVIYMSGYNSELVSTDVAAQKGKFLSKPFTPSQLLETVTLALSRN